MSVQFGDAESLQPLSVISAVEDIPFLASLEDFLFLRTDLRADLRVHLFFQFQQRRDYVHDFLADRVAVLDKVHFGTGHEKIDDSVGQSNRLFAAQAHVNEGSVSFRERAALLLSCTSLDRMLPFASSLLSNAPISRAPLH